MIEELDWKYKEEAREMYLIYKPLRFE